MPRWQRSRNGCTAREVPNWSSSTWPTWRRCGGARPRSWSRRPAWTCWSTTRDSCSAERAVTVDGYEATFATNHLGPFLLTNLLLERLKASAPSRVVNVASTAHNAARKGIPFDDLHSSTHYRAMRVYGESKLANMLFTLELARRLDGSGVTANSLHPGTVRSGYGGGGDTRGFLAFGIKIASPFFLSAAKGARTSVYLASSPEVEGVSGQYFVKCAPRTPRRWALDPDAAQRLWQVSEELVGLAPAEAA